MIFSPGVSGKIFIKYFLLKQHAFIIKPVKLLLILQLRITLYGGD